MNLKAIVKFTLGVIITIEGIALIAPALKITPVAEARGCVPTGTKVRGMPVLDCRGASCCRKIGRTTINGKRYQKLDCSRCGRRR
jgi:hypothetical protein